tara:strand:+ start:1012 stop:1260 length:249 start_codon:yes stop_codon:yes gene_type:complete
MIIPIRCFTCNKVISDKWVPFVERVNQEKQNSTDSIKDLDIEYIDLKKPNKSIEGKVMDELELHRYCCRRMFLGNVHLITYI